MNEAGYCQCGCGNKTPISVRGKNKGAPTLYINGHWKKGVPEAVRFWSKVRKTEGCWEWVGARNAFGYGTFSKGERPIRTLVRAHRYAWEVAFGPIPDGLKVLHKCDNPPCVNPDHLFLGTDQDNCDDKLAKGRYRHGPCHGSNNSNARLTPHQIAEIRNTAVVPGDRVHGYSAIGRRYGITPQHTWSIIKGLSWTTLEEELKELND